jgi:hypothetical protein
VRFALVAGGFALELAGRSLSGFIVTSFPVTRLVTRLYIGNGSFWADDETQVHPHLQAPSAFILHVSIPVTPCMLSRGTNASMSMSRCALLGFLCTSKITVSIQFSFATPYTSNTNAQPDHEQLEEPPDSSAPS